MKLEPPRNAKYISFDIDSKKTAACVVRQGQKDRYSALITDLQEMRQYLRQQRQDGGEAHLTDLLEEFKLLTILRSMLQTGELFHEELASYGFGLMLARAVSS